MLIWGMRAKKNNEMPIRCQNFQSLTILGIGKNVEQEELSYISQKTRYKLLKALWKIDCHLLPKLNMQFYSYLCTHPTETLTCLRDM